MHWLFNALADRIKAMFVTNVALDFEAQLTARDAERKAELLRQAKGYDDEGLEELARELRDGASRLSLERPFASVLPAVAQLRSPIDGPIESAEQPPRIESPEAVAAARSQVAPLSKDLKKPKRR